MFYWVFGVIHLIITVFAGVFIGLGFHRAGTQFEELGKIIGVTFTLCGIIGAVAGILPLVISTLSSASSITSGEALVNHILTTFSILFYFFLYLIVDGFIGAISSLTAYIVSDIISMVKEEPLFPDNYW